MEEINLNIIPTNQTETCHVKQHDNKRSVKANLLDGGLMYAIKAGDTISLNIKKPDDSEITTIVESTEGNNFVLINVTADMCDVIGTNICELRIVNGDENVGTSNFDMIVETNPIPITPTPTKKGGLNASESEVISTTYETV